jgi:Family of unknown function (DUF6084)
VTPDPEFWVLDADALAFAAAPTLVFRLRIKDRSEREIYTVALSVMIQLEAIQRAHDDEARDRLRDVFGDPERWGDTARAVLWAKQDVLVPSFTGSTTFDLQVPCNSDLELATSRWFEAVSDGVAPLAFHFSGSVFYRGESDRMQLTRVPWHATAQFRLPVETWRKAAGEGGGVVRVSADTFEALQRRRIERGLLSLDDAVADLLERTR